MNTAKPIVEVFPLPRQLRAENKAELSKKIDELRIQHGDFLASPYPDKKTGGWIAYLKR